MGSMLGKPIQRTTAVEAAPKLATSRPGRTDDSAPKPILQHGDRVQPHVVARP